MSGLTNISISNLPQIDHHQDDIHRGPIINQEQNAQIHKSEAERRISMPVEPDKTEGKSVDVRNNLINDSKQKRKKRKNVIEKRKKSFNSDNDGYFVDVQA